MREGGLYVCSDLHLGVPSPARMFVDASQGRALAALCAEVAEAGGELVLDGDIFDVTAAQPPERGLTAFGRALGVPEIEDRPRLPLPEVMRAIRAANPVAMEALGALAAAGRVTLVPGNHDRHLGEPEGKAALEAAGLAGMRVEEVAVRHLGERCVVLTHGHQWDRANATPRGGGEVMTGVLHHAVLPYLQSLAPRLNVTVEPDRLFALRPEERVVPVLQRWLPPGAFERFLDALVELLVVNGTLPRSLAWLVSAVRLRKRLRSADDLWERAGRAALFALEGKGEIPGRPPPPDVLVLGHTHVLDWAVQDGRPRVDPRTGGSGEPVQRLYVNLGTWTARASDAAGPMAVTLPVFQARLEGRRLAATLRDFREPGRELRRFESQA